jgi:hypothetical protein
MIAIALTLAGLILVAVALMAMPALIVAWFDPPSVRTIPVLRWIAIWHERKHDA